MYVKSPKNGQGVDLPTLKAKLASLDAIDAVLQNVREFHEPNGAVDNLPNVKAELPALLPIRFQPPPPPPFECQRLRLGLPPSPVLWVLAVQTWGSLVLDERKPLLYLILSA